MEKLKFLSWGLIVGFSIAAPVGPVGLLCIKRTLQSGRLAGLFSGFGAAFADTFYGFLAAFSLSFVSEFLCCWQPWLKVLGGLFIIYLGIKTIFSPLPSKEAVSSKKVGTHLANFSSTFFLTLTNPLTIISFLAIYTALGLANVQESFVNASFLVIGVFIGSSLWWLLLSEGLTFFRPKLQPQTLHGINRLAGCVLVLFGLVILCDYLFSLFSL